MTDDDIYRLRHTLNIDVIWQIFHEINKTPVFGGNVYFLSQIPLRG